MWTDIWRRNTRGSFGEIKKKKKENWHELYDVYLPLVRLRTSMNSRNDIFGQRMPGVVVVYRPCHGFRRHLDE